MDRRHGLSERGTGRRLKVPHVAAFVAGPTAAVVAHASVLETLVAATIVAAALATIEGDGAGASSGLAGLGRGRDA